LTSTPIYDIIITINIIEFNMLKKELFGEFFGTFIMMLFGTGAAASQILYGSYSGTLQTAALWGTAVALAIYVTRQFSSAHFNPAVTLAMVITGQTPAKKILPFVLAQLFGSFAASFVIYSLFAPQIKAFESITGIVRGTPESALSAQIFCEYYSTSASAEITMLHACLAEVFGTFMLITMILCLTDKANKKRPSDDISPLVIGLTVTSAICLIAPITDACFNPVRDFAPRMTAVIFGWGDIAMPDGTGGFFWVYILSPLVGAALSGCLFKLFIKPKIYKI
jgi:glycerol uptake facilitator protein